jgi:hypothetical protein
MTKKEAEELARELFLDGRMIEAGWVRTFAHTAPEGIDEEEVLMMKYVYFAGAAHAMHLLLNPPGKTMEERKRIAGVIIKDVKNEIDAFYREFSGKAVGMLSNNLH